MTRDLAEIGISLQKVVTRLLSNQNLLKLLYYNDKDPLSHEDITQTQIEKEIYEKLVKIVPRVGPKETANSLIALRVVRGRPLDNDDFQSILVQVEVFVPMTQWFIKNSNLRPFCIMGEVCKTLNNKIINGLGRMTYEGFDLNFLTDEMSCYELSFEITEYE